MHLDRIITAPAQSFFLLGPRGSGISTCAYGDYRKLCDAFYYWAPAGRSATEVDFLIDQGGEFVAVEAKAGKTFSESWCKGLRAVQPLRGLRRRIVVYPEGPALATEDGIEVLPFVQFAEVLAAEAL
ncbi:hypothetical protein ACFL6X_01340 [Candidatus Latescibacterota bacterium]